MHCGRALTDLPLEILPRCSTPMPRSASLAACLVLLLAVGSDRLAAAQQPGDTTRGAGAADPRLRTPRGGFDFTLFDGPYNVAEGIRGPSMRQTLDLSVAAYDVTHSAIERAFGRRRKLGLAAVALFDWLTTVEVALPLSDVWVHEEFHRAVMGRRAVNSFNDVYRLDISATWIAVSHVRDEELVRIKRDHPADWVRTPAAGMEGELLLVRELERRRFFGYSRAWHLPLYWLTKLGTAGYVASGTWSDVDADTDLANDHDGANVQRRDFTGHDFLGWVYDLHRPMEPYEARGIHPSGVGLDRYIKLTDLTEEERRFLKRQGKLQLLNFVDPFLFGINRGITLGGGATPTRVSAGLSHFLTSFGYAVDANVLVQRGDANVAVTLHGFVNDERVFPGAEAELIDHPMTVRGRPLAITARAGLWLQPENQAFRTSDASLGGMTSVRVRTALSGRFGGFAELELKTPGWVAGTPYLNGGAAVRMGLSTIPR